jgi:hypothetical protein
VKDDGKDLKGRGRCLILRYYPSISMQGRRKTMETSVRIAGLRAEIMSRAECPFLERMQANLQPIARPI